MKSIGVMIHSLFDGRDETVAALEQSFLKTIQSVKIDAEGNGGDGELRIAFTDETTLLLRDAGRSCCESRYLHTDDSLDAHVGATLVEVSVQEGPEGESEWGEHEIAFLHVKTSAGTFVVETHNEHNGYYGGFWLTAEVETL